MRIVTLSFFAAGALLFATPTLGGDTHKRLENTSEASSFDEELAQDAAQQEELVKNQRNLEIEDWVREVTVLKKALVGKTISENSSDNASLLPTYKPLSAARKIKQSLDIFLNPKESLVTKTAGFADAKMVLEGTKFGANKAPADVAKLMKEAGITLGVRVGPEVLAVTEQFAKTNEIDVQLILRGLASGATPVTAMGQGESTIRFGYLFSEKAALDHPELAKVAEITEPMITWDEQGAKLPYKLQQQLQNLEPGNI